MELTLSILVVDRDQRTRTLLKETLEAHQLTVFEASSFEEGLLLFKKEPLELVVTDAVINQEAPLAFLRELRSLSSLPVVIVAEDQGESQRLKSFELGADDFVQKPFSPEEVYLRINRLLRYYYQGSPFMVSGQHYVFPDMTIDLGRKKVTVAGKHANLTAIEFNLLSYFVNHSDQVLSRRQLLEDVWGYQILGEERTVDVHIRRLRQKLGAYSEATASRIVTVYQRGYRFQSNLAKVIK